jgi:hypothetical protein
MTPGFAIRSKPEQRTQNRLHRKPSLQEKSSGTATRAKELVMNQCNEGHCDDASQNRRTLEPSDLIPG